LPSQIVALAEAAVLAELMFVVVRGFPGKSNAPETTDSIEHTTSRRAPTIDGRILFCSPFLEPGLQKYMRKNHASRNCWIEGPAGE
jgi:hypothetical protein